MKRIIFSHESDIDGMGGVILAKIAFSEIDFELFPNVDELEKQFRNYIENNYFDNYDEIYITDLSLLRPSIDIVNEDNILKNKLKIFDHHQRAIDDGLGNYSFVTIEEKNKDGMKRCATEIFYEYLYKNNMIDKNDTLDEFCELTRLEDTWTWRENNPKAHDLAVLFSAIGIEKYIDLMVKKIKKQDMTFSENDLKRIKEKKEEYEKELNKYIDSSLILTDENNNRFGITFAPYEYRNEITDKIIVDGNKNNICYMIVVAFDKGEFGQKSYRSVVTGMDVNAVAKLHGGGGHPGAAGVYLTKEQKENALKLEHDEALNYLAKCTYKK
ncbi:MAG: hypothetical protein IJH20_04915 [Bacilli bacterium]|nr:hypothetical protein [Bacilli bacterium]